MSPGNTFKASPVLVHIVWYVFCVVIAYINMQIKNIISGCGQTPTISNGNITAHNGTLFGAMAIVSCDMGYVASANTSTCNNSGYWSTAQCDIISNFPYPRSSTFVC